MPKMKEDELIAIIDARLTDAKSFDRSDMVNHREWALRFFDGEVDFDSQEGRSRVVSHDLADVTEWILAGLMRVFTVTDRVAIYEPNTPEEEEGAEQATFGVNHIFIHECDGYRVLKDSIHNGLLLGNGPIKLWWEGAPEYKTEDIRGLTEEEVLTLASEPDVEDILDVKGYNVNPDGQPAKEDGDAPASY